MGSYRAAEAAAVPSAAALAIVLKRVWDYLATPALGGSSHFGASHKTPAVKGFSLCLYAHSQGNLLVEIMTKSKVLNGATLRLNSVILHQADVDAHDHHGWVNQLSYCNGVIITLNEYDSILRLSDAINPERLGIASRGLNAQASYFDFTHGDMVGATHNIFAEVENKIVLLFCDRALRGYPPNSIGGLSSGFVFEETHGAWRLQGAIEDDK